MWTWTYKRRTTKQQLVDGWVDVPKNAHNNFRYSIFFVRSLAIHRLVGLLPCINAPHNGKYTPKKKLYIIKYQKQVFFRLVSHGRRRISFRIHDRSGFLVTEGNCDETKDNSHVFLLPMKGKGRSLKCVKVKSAAVQCVPHLLFCSVGGERKLQHIVDHFVWVDFF